MGTAGMTKAPTKKAEKPKSPAEWAHDRLVMYIRNFESQLDAAHEIAMGFAGDEAGVLRIEGIGYFDPDIVTFYGRDDSGAKTQLIQHVSQLSVTLRCPRKPKATRHAGSGSSLARAVGWAAIPAMPRPDGGPCGASPP